MTGKNIIFCFDGTCNHPKDAKQEREWFGLGEIEDNGITNVLKLHVMLGGNLKNTPANKNQHSFYYSGVGTYGNKVQQIFNSAFAPKNKDVARIIKDAGGDLKDIYKEGDSVFLFGFSRGAAIARRFASVIHNYLPEGAEPEGVVRFLGVFDTVASIGFPNLDDEDKPISDVIFENGTVSSHVQEALHLLSLDEKRIAFQPTLMNKEGKVTEIWFPGAHSDIGGGFWYDGLSDITLKFMVDQIKTRKIGLKLTHPRKVKYNNLRGPKGVYEIDLDDVFIKPNHKGKMHPQDRWWPVAKATLETRSVRVNENDEPADNVRPLVHHSVVDRIKDVIEYRPKSLKGRKHSLLNVDASTVDHKGIIDHIDV